MTTFAHFLELDAALVSAGFPPTPPWWLEQLEGFYAHPTARRLVARVGRGGVKSTTAVKFALCELLFGSWQVAPGERHWGVFVSVRSDEAMARLRQAETMCQALGIESRLVGDELRFEHLPLGMKVFPGTVGAVSGPRAVCKVGDEVSKWWSDDRKANPAREVIASMRAMSVTHAGAREFLVSSAFGTVDYHHELVEAGTNEQQLVVEAPTWIANPSITEEQTHELEPDTAIWSREYAAKPGVTVTNAFDPADLAACFGRAPLGDEVRAFISTDFSSLRNDGTAYIAGHETHVGELVIREVDGWDGEQLRHVEMDDLVATIAKRARFWGCKTVFGDQREEASLRSLFAKHKLVFKSYAWTEKSKDAAVMMLRRLKRERKLVICSEQPTPTPSKAPVLRRQLAGMKAHLTPSGRTHYATNGLDYASALITLAHAGLEGDALKFRQRSVGLISANGGRNLSGEAVRGVTVWRGQKLTPEQEWKKIWNDEGRRR